MLTRFIRPLAAIALASPLALAAGPAAPTLLGLENGYADPTLHRLCTIDATTAQILSAVQVTVPGSTLTGSTGLARHPSSGVLYALIRTGASPVTGEPIQILATLDPATGVATPVGDPMGDKFAGIAFLPDGRLFGVTGDGAADPEAFYEINPATAAATRLAHFGRGDDGETLGSTTDGRLFHASGINDGDEYFERVDPEGAGDLVDILLSHTYDLNQEILALGWSDAHQQLFGCNRNNELFTIDRATGAQTLINDMGAYCKGLAFAGATLYALDNGTSVGFPQLYTVNPATAEILSTVEVILFGEDLVKGNGLARNPVTGELWAIVENALGARFLVTIDPATGEATDQGMLPDRFAGIAFRADGSLIGVTGNGADQPETLFLLHPGPLVSADVLLPLGDGADGEAIAIAADGFLYHTSGIDPGDEFFQRIDPTFSHPFLTDIGDGSHAFAYSEATAMGYSADLQQMFLADINGDLYTIDLESGETNLLGHFDESSNADGLKYHTIKGLVFLNPLVIPCPGDANGDGLVDFLDLNIVLSSYGAAQGQPGYLPGADLNGDHVVDFLDLNIVLSFYGTSC